MAGFFTRDLSFLQKILFTQKAISLALQLPTAIPLQKKFTVCLPFYQASNICQN